MTAAKSPQSFCFRRAVFDLQKTSKRFLDVFVFFEGFCCIISLYMCQWGGIIMWHDIGEFFTSVPLWEICLIFFAKVIEVSTSTLRIIYINKGFRKLGTMLSLVEIFLWVFIASRVIIGLSEAPFKGIIYGLGFASGVYVGSIIENYLAVGKIFIQAIIMREEAAKVIQELRNAGYGVTVVSAQGKDRSRKVLLMYTNRKNKPDIMRRINALDDDAVIVSNEVSMIKGGYVNAFRKIAK